MTRWLKSAFFSASSTTTKSKTQGQWTLILTFFQLILCSFCFFGSQITFTQYNNLWQLVVVLVRTCGTFVVVTQILKTLPFRVNVWTFLVPNLLLDAFQKCWFLWLRECNVPLRHLLDAMLAFKVTSRDFAWDEFRGHKDSILVCDNPYDVRLDVLSLEFLRFVIGLLWEDLAKTHTFKPSLLSLNFPTENVRNLG